MYYIISLKHTQKHEQYITLWRSDNCGYCYAKEDAGIYESIVENYHDAKGDSIPIEVDKLNGLFIDSNILYNNTAKKCIPNCKQVWDILGFKMTKNGLILSNKNKIFLDSDLSEEETKEWESLGRKPAE